MHALFHEWLVFATFISSDALRTLISTQNCSSFRGTTAVSILIWSHVLKSRCCAWNWIILSSFGLFFRCMANNQFQMQGCKIGRDRTENARTSSNFGVLLFFASIYVNYCKQLDDSNLSDMHFKSFQANRNNVFGRPIQIRKRQLCFLLFSM